MKTEKRNDRVRTRHFRIEKLEERIAPKKGGIPGNCSYAGYPRTNPHGTIVGSWKCRVYY